MKKIIRVTIKIEDESSINTTLAEIQSDHILHQVVSTTTEGITNKRVHMLLLVEKRTDV